MNRIEERLAKVKAENKKALITYLTAGLPSMEKTVEIIKAQADAGVDVVEVGIPFSDPIADGPTIQAASLRSIQNGTNLRKVFDCIAKLRETCQVPVVFSLYYNTLFHYGVKEFVEKCKEVGVDGVIVPDLPLEEQDDINQYLAGEDAPVIIQLVAQTTKGRINKVLENARGFVYCTCLMDDLRGGCESQAAINNYLKNVKSVSKIPVMMGYDLNKATDIEPYFDNIDGVIVGTQVIDILDKSNFDENMVAEFVTEFKDEMNK